METAELEKILFRIRPDDIIAALLFNLPERFRADKEVIHTTIINLAEDYPDLFSWFEVTSDFPYPFSRCLEDTLHRLGQDRILSILNPSFSVYAIDEEARKTIQRRIWDRKFSPEQKENLTRAATILAKATSIEEKG